MERLSVMIRQIIDIIKMYNLNNEISLIIIANKMQLNIFYSDNSILDVNDYMINIFKIDNIKIWTVEAYEDQDAYFTPKIVIEGKENEKILSELNNLDITK